MVPSPRGGWWVSFQTTHVSPDPLRGLRPPRPPCPHTAFTLLNSVLSAACLHPLLCIQSPPSAPSSRKPILIAPGSQHTPLSLLPELPLLVACEDERAGGHRGRSKDRPVSVSSRVREGHKLTRPPGSGATRATDWQVPPGRCPAVTRVCTASRPVQRTGNKTGRRGGGSPSQGGRGNQGGGGTPCAGKQPGSPHTELAPILPPPPRKRWPWTEPPAAKRRRISAVTPFESSPTLAETPRNDRV